MPTAGLVAPRKEICEHGSIITQRCWLTGYLDMVVSAVLRVAGTRCSTLPRTRKEERLPDSLASLFAGRYQSRLFFRWGVLAPGLIQWRRRRRNRRRRRRMVRCSVASKPARNASGHCGGEKGERGDQEGDCGPKTSTHRLNTLVAMTFGACYLWIVPGDH